MKVPPFFSSPAGMIVIVLVLIIAIVYGRSAFKSVGHNVKKKAEIDTLKLSGEKQSFANEEYDSMADKLEEAISGLGTDEDAVFEVFDSLENTLDFIMLDRAFGVRDNENMRQWIIGDMSSSDIKLINDQLKNQGITKRI